MALTLEQRIEALERTLAARAAAEQPVSYYTSRYSGEEIDERLSATGDTILVSNGSPQTISAALSNKANVYLDLSAVGLSGQVTISQVCAAMQDGRFFAAWNDTSLENCISDAPDTYTLITIYRAAAPYVICRAVRMSDGKEYVGTWNPDREPNWTGWMEQACATPPQQFNLPLADGLIQSSASWYSKDQFGQVHVHGAISAGSGSLEWDTLVATLPEGYRPSAKIESAAAFASGVENGPGSVAVSADGTIKVFPDISVAQKVAYFDLFFSAD